MVFVQAPIWGSQHFKAPVKMGMAIGVTLLAYPNLTIPEPFPLELRGFLISVLMQLAVGLVIGWVSFLVMATAQFGGEMLDIQMGLSAAAQADPSSHGAVNLLRRLHFYMAMMLYLLGNGHLKLWQALFESFRIVPLTYFQMTDMQIESLLRMAGEIYVVGLEIASPVVGALFVAQIALGMVARAAPQMNVFMISFPMNLGIGLLMLGIASTWLLQTLEQRFGVNNDQVNSAIWQMSPKAAKKVQLSPTPNPKLKPAR